MASIIRQFTKSIPAGTQKNALYTSPISFPTEPTYSIDLEVPPGPAGLMGFYLAISGQQMIPFETGEFIVWDDRFDTWNLEDYPETGTWALYGYNLDIVNAHDVVIRFHNSELTQSNVPTPTINVINGVTSDIGAIL